MKVIEMFKIKKLQRQMKKLDKLVTGLDNELLLYLLNRIGDEMEKRTYEMEFIQNAQLEQEKVSTKTKET